MEESLKNQEPEKPLSEEEQKALWSKEMEEHTGMQNYFAGYRADSVESFKKNYLSLKGYWMKTWPGFKEDKEIFGFKWVDIAFDQIKVILQKKLFNAQCLWRAEQLKIKEISITYEFNVWEKDILNCPFIEPVTAGDIELYISFLETKQHETKTYADYHYEYEEVRKAAKTEEDLYGDYPEWYTFYDNINRTQELLLLPDIRKEKEEFYIDLARKEYWKKNENKNSAAAEERERKKDKREKLKYYEEEVIEQFVKTFEPESVRTAYDNYEWALRNYHKMEHLEPYLDLLYEADEEVPLEENTNWLEAIKITAEKYKRRKITEALPIAFEQYKMNVEMGIGFPGPKRISKTDEFLITHYSKEIIKGRLLNGEPEDLNF